MTSATRLLASLLLLVAAATSPGLGGGALESYDITAGLPSPIAGHILADVIPIRWATRCVPVRYSLNTTLDPIPNPLGPAFLTAAAAGATLQDAMDAWNEVPTSFIDLQLTGSSANPGLRGFDMVNELTFRTAAGFGAIASSPSSTLIADTTLVDGDDIDGDGDSDVSGAISTCQDADGDGDIELPAGLYPAGTILENDVQFNTKVSNGLRFTTTDAELDTVLRSVDLMAVAVHELGHSFGLSHVLNNQLSATDGSGATMFPFISTTDPVEELRQRSLDSDDIAFASFFYPEGTAPSGPAALQAGDMAFASVYGFIRGEIHHGVLGQPVAGASVSALDRKSQKLVATAFSGRTRLSFDPATGGVAYLPLAGNGVIDGEYVLPVPFGQYLVGIEPVDGFPAAAANIGFTAQIGGFYGHQNFLEEFYQGGGEDSVETKYGQATPIPVNNSGTSSSGIDLVTNVAAAIANFGNLNFVGFTGLPAGLFYAVQIPAAQLQAAFDLGSTLIQAAEFFTVVADPSVVPVFAEAALATGVVTGSTAALDLARPLARARGFVGQDADFAPFYFNDPEALGGRVQGGIDDGTIENLFLVLRLPTSLPYPGVNGLPPLIGLDGGVPGNDVPIQGRSFVSADGGATFTRNAVFNFMFRLILSPPP